MDDNILIPIPKLPISSSVRSWHPPATNCRWASDYSFCFLIHSTIILITITMVILQFILPSTPQPVVSKMSHVNCECVNVIIGTVQRQRSCGSPDPSLSGSRGPTQICTDPHFFTAVLLYMVCNPQYYPLTSSLSPWSSLISVPVYFS